MDTAVFDVVTIVMTVHHSEAVITMLLFMLVAVLETTAVESTSDVNAVLKTCIPKIRYAL